ncbi:45720_t:CDS:2, partial [Gigaspora margarita]
MSTLGNVSNYEPLSKEKSSVNEASKKYRRNNTIFKLLKSNNTLAKFRELWWTQGNIHPSAKWEEASDVDWEKYTERTDFFKVRGSWEWINGQDLMGLVLEQLKGTRAGNMEKEADGSFIPSNKPYVNSNGREGSDSHLPWPNLAIEVTSLETKAHLLDAIKNYWLSSGRAHDAIALKLVRSDTIISRIKVWHFCTDNRTLGELVPVTEFGFETIDDNNQILIQPQQFTININTECLFYKMPSDF